MRLFLLNFLQLSVADIGLCPDTESRQDFGKILFLLPGGVFNLLRHFLPVLRSLGYNERCVHKPEPESDGRPCGYLQERYGNRILERAFIVRSD